MAGVGVERWGICGRMALIWVFPGVRGVAGVVLRFPTSLRLSIRLFTCLIFFYFHLQMEQHAVQPTVLDLSLLSLPTFTNNNK